MNLEVIVYFDPVLLDYTLTKERDVFSETDYSFQTQSRRNRL